MFFSSTLYHYKANYLPKENIVKLNQLGYNKIENKETSYEQIYPKIKKQ